MTSTIRLMHYAAAWRQEFEQSKSGILQSCQGNVSDVQHIGSTAIPGLIARPIIDMVAIVSAVELLDEAAMQIQGLFFRMIETPSWCRDSLVLSKPRHGDATHLVFLTTPESRTHRRTVAIRDHLRAQPARAVEFEAAKVRRWKDVDGDSTHYDRDKAIFIAHLEEQLGFS
jgi:GrpB-like predicted nucleotidyltransferase (UPF0157 family)